MAAREPDCPHAPLRAPQIRRSMIDGNDGQRFIKTLIKSLDEVTPQGGGMAHGAVPARRALTRHPHPTAIHRRGVQDLHVGSHQKHQLQVSDLNRTCASMGTRARSSRGPQGHLKCAAQTGGGRGALQVIAHVALEMESKASSASVQSQNPLGWKRPPRPPSPTLEMALSQLSAGHECCHQMPPHLCSQCPLAWHTPTAPSVGSAAPGPPPISSFPTPISRSHVPDPPGAWILPEPVAI